MDLTEFRANFPLASKVVYFDSAASSLTVQPVLDKMNEYYLEYRSNIHRGAHRLTRKASEEYDRTYEILAKCLKGKESEFIDVRNTTEAINFVATGIDYSKRNEVVVTNIEHHSNLLPWIRLEERGRIVLKVVKANKEGRLDLEEFKKAVNNKTAIVSFTAASNVLGNKTPVREVCEIARDAGALSLVDSAQAVGHVKVDLKHANCDFAAFSAHKCFGPTGVGALYHKEGVRLEPAFLGGGTILEAGLHSYKLTNDRQRFEAGTPNIAGWIGLGTAIEFISRNFAFMEEQERKLVKAMMGIAEKADYYGPLNAEEKIPVFSFNVGKLKQHEVAVMFDQLSRICVRSGHHCAMPLHHELLKVDGSVRASLHSYNTLEEVELFFSTLEKVKKLN